MPTEYEFKMLIMMEIRLYMLHAAKWLVRNGLFKRENIFYYGNVILQNGALTDSHKYSSIENVYM